MFPRLCIHTNCLCVPCAHARARAAHGRGGSGIGCRVAPLNVYDYVLHSHEHTSRAPLCLSSRAPRMARIAVLSTRKRTLCFCKDKRNCISHSHSLSRLLFSWRETNDDLDVTGLTTRSGEALVVQSASSAYRKVIVVDHLHHPSWVTISTHPKRRGIQSENIIRARDLALEACDHAELKTLKEPRENRVAVNALELTQENIGRGSS